MTTPIIPNLSFGPNQSSLPPPAELLLITDHLNSPADFVLHRILATHLKEVEESQVIVVSFALEFAQWRAIAAKSNVNLAQYQSSGSLIFLDGLRASELSSSDSPPHPDPLVQMSSPSLFQPEGNGVRSLYLMLERALRHNERLPHDAAQGMIVLDGLSILEMIGVPTLELTRLVRALRALCRARAASLVIRAHALPAAVSDIPFDSELLRALVESCNAHVEVRPLASGRSGAVSGEVAVHLGGLSLAHDGNLEGWGRRGAMQYRLSDGGVTFFQRGMGAGVL